MLAWSSKLDFKLDRISKPQVLSERVKYNVNSNSEEFIIDEETKRCLFDKVQNLESSLRRQDKAYNEFSNIVELLTGDHLQER